MKRMLTILLIWVCISSCMAQAPKHRKPASAAVLLQGIWAQKKEDNAAMWVKGNRLMYGEFLDTWLKYTFTPTKLTIFAQDGPDVYRIKKLTRDSLVLIGNSGTSIWRLYRR
ncbi:hypothetical protein ACFST9_09690 [Hymenobacter monticola]|uniref:Lipocalin-like domain-containing protein n=1 Tax=Hymenobacter monticola TaxID=1705399 RepID=A0ABY4B9G4_9BACT|nr:hypothetical protein [Hymenobacter monticola]UOE35529.1 hypothetical protein MTP16_07715 [Hymenobacter monticola]